jgi:transcriptional regulator with XRE-family HTH domain
MQQHDLKAIGARIKTIRKTTDALQQDLAKDSGLTVKTISHVENGHTLPPQELLGALSDKYGYNIDWILTGTGKEKKTKGKDNSNANIQAKVHKLDMELKEMKKMLQALLEKINS